MGWTIDFKFDSACFETKLNTIIHFTEPTLSLTNNGRSNCQLAVQLTTAGQPAVRPPTGSYYYQPRLFFNIHGNEQYF